MTPDTQHALDELERDTATDAGEAFARLAARCFSETAAGGGRVSTTVPTGDISQTAPDWLSAAVTASVHTATASGADTWWPIDRGCVSLLLSGRTSRSTRASTSSSGRPSAGIGSSKRVARPPGAAAVENVVAAVVQSTIVAPTVLFAFHS